MNIVERIVDGRVPDISPPLRDKAKPFIKLIKEMRTLAESVRTFFGDIPRVINSS